jgi:hypothetical protein
MRHQHMSIRPVVLMRACSVRRLLCEVSKTVARERVKRAGQANGAVMITTTVFLLLESAPIKAPGALSSDPGGLVWAVGYVGWMGTIWFRSRAAK